MDRIGPASTQAGAAGAYRLPRTARCLSCSYPLEGLPDPRCPECGRAFDPRDPRTVLTARRGRRRRESRAMLLGAGGGVASALLTALAMETNTPLVVLAAFIVTPVLTVGVCAPRLTRGLVVLWLALVVSVAHLVGLLAYLIIVEIDRLLFLLSVAYYLIFAAVMLPLIWGLSALVGGVAFRLSRRQ